MPPKAAEPKPHFRTLAVDDQIKKLNQKADALLQKQQLRLIGDVLKSQPELILGVVKHLESKGVEFGPLQRFGKSRSKKDLEETPGADDGKDKEDGDSPGSKEPPKKVRKTCEIDDKDPKNWLPHAYTRLDNTKPPVLEEILSHVREISFSPYILKALKPKGCKASDYQQKLCELLEFACGVDVEKPLQGALRHIPTLKKTLAEMSAQTGGRGRDLKLPPDWEHKHGVYQLTSNEDGAVTVHHRYAKLTVQVPEDAHFTDEQGDLVDVQELVVEKNYSQDKAVITWSGSPESVLIASLPWPSDALTAGKDANVKKNDAKSAQNPASPDAAKLRRKPSQLSLQGSAVEGLSPETSPSKA